MVGPEVIAGSTRLKAGTAQKLVLNMISTISMIRLGKTFGNLMVDVVATNDKLRARVRRIVGHATGASDEQVDAALDDADGDAKVAIVALTRGRRRCDGASAARRRPAASSGRRSRREARRRGRARRRPARPGRRRGRRRHDRRRRARAGVGSGIAVPGFVDLQVNGFAGVDFLGADADGFAAAGEALLETGVTAYLPTLITSAEEDMVARAARDPEREITGRGSSACTSRGRSSPPPGSARTASARGAIPTRRCSSACSTPAPSGS